MTVSEIAALESAMEMSGEMNSYLLTHVGNGRISVNRLNSKKDKEL